MNTKELKTRDQIDNKYKWNIEAMIPDESVISGELETIKKEAEAYGEDFAGRLTESADTLLAAFQKRDDIWRRLEKIYVYARMRRDENNAETKYQAMADQCNSVIAAVSASMAFFTPELLSASEETILAYIDAAPGLEIYRFAICDTMRQKAHILTQAEENILAQMSEITGATNDIFTMLNNADIKFGTIIDEDGDETEVTHGNFIKFMESHDRDVRKNAYNAVYDAYKELINTIASAYNYNTKTDVVSARIRKYESARAAALSGDNIPAEVYDNLVAEVHKNLPAMHRYVELRKKLLGVDKLYMYDMYVPLIKLPETSVSFEEGLDIMRDALQPLGEEYLTKMNKGIEEGWIDVYENKGKTSGAYSFGCYDSYPYILLNYTDTLKDVFTIIHEMGHSMHSRYTRDEQPYIYGSHSIFTAEVASTVNESLLMQHLLRTEDEKEMRKYLLNMHLEEFRTTLFRQTMFAEFEDITHKAIESGETLTAEWMCQQYEDLNAQYYGSAVEKDDVIRYEWARIPHFYNAFYVYKYATGYSAATAISKKILTEGKPAAQDYIRFLKTGESDHPIELLKIAGVDMSSPLPVQQAMETFNQLLDEFESLL
ncbi:oligoendopeptidase F [Clostridiales Family XIII bacterium BX16]|uniref:Oligopeptidase F n=1 Tax=Lentihominibacter faecis TaxID=2764712 RepID=A0A923NA56_9FIRM|nr:oligoendopeptidase F [Lentihominibacter faecis]MBC5998980.1 oligoendopeptidase F [Lentihominibacter faecis]